MNKNIMILWGSLIILICGMLLILGFNLEDNRIKRELISATNKYMKDNEIKLAPANATIVYINELIDLNYLEDSNKYEEKCINSVVVSRKILMNDYILSKDCNEKVDEINN